MYAEPISLRLPPSQHYPFSSIEEPMAKSNVKIRGRKCSNCRRPNLIYRPWRDDIFCGWCGTEYKNEGLNGNLSIVEIHNNHHTERVKEQMRKTESLIA